MMPSWLRVNGEIVVCDDYVFWANGLGWVPGAMLGYLGKHRPELLCEYIQHVLLYEHADYDSWIKKD